MSRKLTNEILGRRITQYDVLERYRALTNALNKYLDGIKIKNNPELGMLAAQLYIEKTNSNTCLGKFIGVLNDDGSVNQDCIEEARKLGAKV